MAIKNSKPYSSLLRSFDDLRGGMDGNQFLVEVRTRSGSIPFIISPGSTRKKILIARLCPGLVSKLPGIIL